MTEAIDYYFTLVSPWAYIGHGLFTTLAARHGAPVAYKPVNLAEVFPNSGGLPLAKRHPLRVAYRTLELQRWREKRGLSFALKPKGWPFDPTLADCVAVALVRRGEDAGPYVAAAFKAVFEAERNLGERDEVARVLATLGHHADVLLADAQSEPIRAAYAQNAQDALAAGVFGSPSYVRGGEVFWGQDRIELLADALATGRAPFKP